MSSNLTCTYVDTAFT